MAGLLCVTRLMLIISWLSHTQRAWLSMKQRAVFVIQSGSLTSRESALVINGLEEKYS